MRENCKVIALCYVNFDAWDYITPCCFFLGAAQAGLGRT